MVEIKSKGDFITFENTEGKGNFIILGEKLYSLKYCTNFGYIEYIHEDNISLIISADSIESNKTLYTIFKQLLDEIKTKFCLTK